MQSPEGKDLFLRVQADDVKAYELIFKGHYQSLCSYACTYLKDMDEAEEVVQQVFLNIWEKRKGINISSSVGGYLFQSVRNECVNKIRHEKVKKMYWTEVEHSGRNPEPAATDVVVARELETQIRDAMESLPEQCQFVFHLSRVEGKKYQEIADQLGISIKTVENHIGKALRIMRRKLAEYLPLFAFFLSLLIP